MKVKVKIMANIAVKIIQFIGKSWGIKKHFLISN